MEKLGWLEAASAALFDRTSEDLIGLLLLGLVVAMAAAGAYQLALRVKAEPFTALVGVMLAGNLLAVAVALAMVRRTPVDVHVTHVNLPAQSRGMGPWPGMGPGGPGPVHSPGRGGSNGFLEAADGDRDGHLTPDEAADFVRVADESGVGWIDGVSLRVAVRRKGNPPAGHAPAPAEPVGPPAPPPAELFPPNTY